MAGLFCLNPVALLCYYRTGCTSPAAASHCDVPRIGRERELSSESTSAVVGQCADSGIRRRYKSGQRRACVGTGRFNS